MSRWGRATILGAAVALSTGLISQRPALAAGVVLEGVVEGMGIVPCLQVDPTSGQERVDAVEVELGRQALITTSLEPPPDDSEPPPDDSRVMQRFGFHLGAGPVTRIVAVCGDARAPERVRLYPLEGEVVRLPTSCSDGMRWNVRFNDGSRLVVDLEVEGESGGDAVTPGEAVAFNPQPEPPGLPFHLVVEWTFDAAVETTVIAIQRAVVHPPEPGEPSEVSWR